MNSFKNKYYSRIGSVCFGMAAVFAMTACSDWDDHYDANTAVTDTQQSTLWENIERNAELSQFAALVRKAGFDQMLNATQAFTVWAPVNGSFDYEALSAENNERLLREFVQNHVARNSYPLSGQVSENIFMLNEKLMHLGGNGSYAIQDIALNSINTGSSNGVLHTITTKIPFMQNIYESLNNEQFDIDSVSNYIHAYDVRELDELRSVQGPTLNGEITYLDSVIYQSNDLFQTSRLNAYINREDSNYTMIVPTNEAWHRARKTVRKLFNYVPSFEYMENTSTGAERKVATIQLKDAAFLTDSMTNTMLASSLFFNNNLYDNKKLASLQTGQVLQCDSLFSTTRFKMYSEDAAHLFKDTRRVEKSNGAIFVTGDSLYMPTWTLWNPELKIEAEFASNVANCFNSAGNTYSSESVSEGSRNPDVKGQISRSRYVEVEPSSQNTNPEIDFYLPGVRSTTYNLYAVMVPANIKNANLEQQPNRFVVTLGYASNDGKSKEERFRNPINNATYFTNDSSKVDTVFIGEFTFPVAYVGTGSSSQEYAPYIRIRSNVTNSVAAQYDRTLRIDCLILRPKELDAHIKENPQYKYDDGTNEN